MINNSKIFNEIVEQLKKISKDDFVNAMKKVDEIFNSTIQVTTSYNISSTDYKVGKELNNYNTVHIKKKTLFNFFKKDDNSINKNSEAA